MTSASKGNLHEREAVAEYHSMGYTVFKPTRCSRYADKDIFNMFDFCAVKGSEVHFVQVKTGTTRGFLKILEAWRLTHPVPGVSWLLWVRLDLRKHSEKWKKY